MFKMNKLFKKINYEKKHQINKNLNRKKNNTLVYILI